MTFIVKVMTYISISSCSSFDNLRIFIQDFSVVTGATMAFFSLGGLGNFLFVVTGEVRTWCSTNAGRRSSSTADETMGSCCCTIMTSSFTTGVLGKGTLLIEGGGVFGKGAATAAEARTGDVTILGEDDKMGVVDLQVVSLLDRPGT